MRHGHVRLLVAVVAVLTASVTASTNARADLRQGAISGVVVTADAAADPVARAVVTARPMSPGRSHSVLTDETGRFTIGGLQPGSYSVIAAKATFVTSAYGARRPARLGAAVSVRADSETSNIRLLLWRGAVVSGAVRNELGRVLQDVPVRAVRVRPDAAVYMTLSNNGARTDAQGTFRIFGLEPGEYVLSAMPAEAQTHASSALRDEYVDHVLRELSAGKRERLRDTADTEARPPTVVHSTVYYPETADPAQAAVISLNSGDERTGLDITFHAVPAVDITGVVRLPDGAPAAGADVRVESVRQRSGIGPVQEPRFSAVSGPGGEFSISHVPPGDYQVSAALREPGAASRDSQVLWAIERLAMRGTPPGSLILHLGPSLSVRGRVQFEGGATGPRTLPDARVALIRSDATVPRTLRDSPLGHIASNSTFSLPGLRPSTEYRLVLDGFPGDWWPQSASLGSVDLLDGPAVLDNATAAGPLTLTFSDTPTRLSGVLTGDPLIENVLVVVFPRDRASWGSERRVKAIQPDAAGHFEFTNLPPGEYWLAAIGDVDPDEWRQAEFLEAASRVSVSVALRKGESRRLDLRTR